MEPAVSSAQTLGFRSRAVPPKTYGSVLMALLKPTCLLLVHMGKCLLTAHTALTVSSRAIESKTHGNVLWAPLDSGATRIGYAYNPEIAKKYPDGVTKEVAVKEAI